MDYIRLTWDDIYADCRKIAWNIVKEKRKFDAILGIARGGMIPARLISDMINNDNLHAIRTKFYETIGKTTKKPEIVYSTLSKKPKKILVIDDIADTGESLVAVLEYLKQQGVKEIFTATLVKKPHSIFTPDIYIRETSAWVIFPWEVYETIREMLKRGMEEKEIIKAGIKIEELNEAKKFYPLI